MTDTHIHTGFWIGRGHGCVVGATLTLSNQAGNLLIAFLAVFVGMVTVDLWQLLCYAIHQIRTTAATKDTLWHQQQALLRNSTSPPKTALDLMRLGLAWRDARPIKTSLWLPCIALLCTVAFNAAGLFSSRLANNPATVLISSPNCGTIGSPGFVFETVNDDFEEDLEYAALSTEFLRDTMYGKAYVDACQGQQQKTMPQCQQLITTDIDQRSLSLVPCPFKDDICLTEAVRVDTGYFDSNADLGINSGREDSILYRRVSECAVLRQDGYVTGWLTEPPDDNPITDTGGATVADTKGDPSKYYYYGAASKHHNYTYRYSNYSNPATSTPYTVSVSWWLEGDATNPWPISALNQTGGDVTLIIMENRAIYGQPTHDPMFAASRNVTDLYQNHQWWLPEAFAANQEVSITACAERVQICNPGSAHDHSTVVCSELAGYLSLPTSELVDGVEVPSNSARPLDMNQKQLATLRRLNVELDNDWIGNSPQVLGQSSLNASSLLWHYEVLYWHKTSLAALQQGVLRWALGPTVSTFKQYLYSARNASNGIYYGAMCDQQKSVSPFHTNFSAFGLVLLLALGTLIILVNLIIPRLVERIRTARDFGSRAQTCWQMDEMLQTQALGYEIANVGTWCDVKYKRESGDTADSKKGKTWKRWGISSEKYPRTVTAEQLPSLYQCTEEKGRCKSESAPSSMQEVVVEVKHEEDVKPAATWPLMGSEQA